jgi:hypothetical protein
MTSVSNGEHLKISPKMFVNKLGKVSRKLGLVKELTFSAVKGLNAKALAKLIPEKYNEKKIKTWQLRVERLFS